LSGVFAYGLSLILAFCHFLWVSRMDKI
jgi:hypothetical protein